MTTNQYMPSEIARLVYGYLVETSCNETVKVFLEESAHLSEFSEGLKRGIKYSTKIHGMTLEETLNKEYSQRSDQRGQSK